MSEIDYGTYLGDSFDPNSGDFDAEKANQSAKDNKDSVNILLVGATGVGKSSLVNALFGDKVVASGVGKPITQHLQKIEIKEKGLVLWDTKGIEAKDYQNTVSQIDDELDDSFKKIEHIKDIPHVAWLCVDASSARVEDRELELIQMLNKYNIPTVVVFTKDMGQDSDEFINVAIKEINLKHGRIVLNRFVRVNSVVRKFSEQFELPVSGMDNLLDVTLDTISEGHKNAAEALKKAQCIRNGMRLDAMISGARKKVHIASAASATAGASPIPGSDAPIIAAIQSKLIYEINSEFALDIEVSKSTAVITSILGMTALAQLGKTIVANVIKIIPGAGTVTGCAISASTAFAITEAIGHAYVLVLEHYFDKDKGCVVLPDNTNDILNVFKMFFKKPF